MTESSDARRVSVARAIRAPAHAIFAILADPARHSEFDGSRTVRSALDSSLITAVGDVFFMEMFLEERGSYRTHNRVVEYEPDRRIAWEPAPTDERGATDAGVSVGTSPGQRWIYELTPLGTDSTLVTETYDCSRANQQVLDRVDNGRVWIRSMTKSLERLDRLCASR